MNLVVFIDVKTGVAHFILLLIMTLLIYKIEPII